MEIRVCAACMDGNLDYGQVGESTAATLYIYSTVAAPSHRYLLSELRLLPVYYFSTMTLVFCRWSTLSACFFRNAEHADAEDSWWRNARDISEERPPSDKGRRMLY